VVHAEIPEVPILCPYLLPLLPNSGSDSASHVGFRVSKEGLHVSRVEVGGWVRIPRET
jgi:hypothetical protein